MRDFAVAATAGIGCVSGGFGLEGGGSIPHLYNRFSCETNDLSFQPDTVIAERGNGLVRCKICYDASESRMRTMSGPPIDELIIVGLTTEGDTFRPSDWAERLCGCMSLFGEDQRISYSPYLKPIIASGIKCVVVDRRLEQMSPEAFSFLMSFCGDNELQIRDGRNEIRQLLQVRKDIRVA